MIEVMLKTKCIETLLVSNNRKKGNGKGKGCDAWTVDSALVPRLEIMKTAHHHLSQYGENNWGTIDAYIRHKIGYENI